MAKDPVFVNGKTYYLDLNVAGKTIEVIYLGRAKDPRHNKGAVIRIVKVHGRVTKNDLIFYKKDSRHVVSISMLSEKKP